MAIKYIVTGTGRCGTMFMSKLLTSAGIDCGHEVIFTNEGLEAAKQNLFLNKETVAESSYMAAPYLNDPILSEATIIHLVRQPMKVINSFVVAYCYFLSGQASCKKNPYQWTYAYPPGADPEFKFMRFIYSHIPDLCKKMSPVERAALYYIKWNQLIEKGCVGRDFIIHPIESDISNLTKFIGIEKEKLYDNVNTNSEKYKDRYKITNIPKGAVRDNLISLGKKYGYFRNINSVL